jgi:hypothetical protein
MSTVQIINSDGSISIYFYDKEHFARRVILIRPNGSVQCTNFFVDSVEEFELIGEIIDLDKMLFPNQ